MKKWTAMITNSTRIPNEFYSRFDVKRGLRDSNGRGVLAGLTNIGGIHSYFVDEGETVPVHGELFYRGYEIKNLVDGFAAENRFGFEEIVYLLLMGELPGQEELRAFYQELAQARLSFPEDFTRSMILNMPSKSIMNSFARSVLSMYSLDEYAESTDTEKVLEQCIRLIAVFPMLAVYSYYAIQHYHRGKSLVIHAPQEQFSTAENFLYMLRKDNQFTDTEAKLLDILLVLHAEHGGGNNSTFTSHVVSSAGTDTYSVVAAALGALKGTRHGGANSKTAQMMADLKAQVSDLEKEEALISYLSNVLDKKAFDGQGLIYGVGHAVYTLSDPRAILLKKYAEKLAEEKGRMKDFQLYQTIERIAPELVMEKKGLRLPVAVNVDFYSGFIYEMLDIPEELLTPLFAMARIAGWCAHRLEEQVNQNKIIRPAYKSVAERKEYIAISQR
ncbi:citrate/2-methylcitrate synthase [Clostridiales bacterium COT073_COT-073]|nr:citrate/2-methylcitrate synthase [Clostridiales bacterium COT073_COT-073]